MTHQYSCTYCVHRQQQIVPKTCHLSPCTWPIPQSQVHLDPPEGRGNKVLASDVILSGPSNSLALFAPLWLKAFGLGLELVNKSVGVTCLPRPRVQAIPSVVVLQHCAFGIGQNFLTVHVDANISDRAHKAEKCNIHGESSQRLNEFVLRSREDWQIGLSRSTKTIATVQHQSLVQYTTPDLQLGLGFNTTFWYAQHKFCLTSHTTNQ